MEKTASGPPPPERSGAAEIRAQRLDGAQACGETALHAPQSRAAGSGGVAGTVALEQFPRLLVWRSRAGGSKQMGRPQNEDTSARRLRAKSIAARGADRPLLKNREKWRTPSSFWSTNQDGHNLYSPRRRGPPPVALPCHSCLPQRCHLRKRA